MTRSYLTSNGIPTTTSRSAAAVRISVSGATLSASMELRLIFTELITRARHWMHLDGPVEMLRSNFV